MKTVSKSKYATRYGALRVAGDCSFYFYVLSDKGRTITIIPMPVHSRLSKWGLVVLQVVS